MGKGSGDRCTKRARERGRERERNLGNYEREREWELSKREREREFTFLVKPTCGRERETSLIHFDLIWKKFQNIPILYSHTILSLSFPPPLVSSSGLPCSHILQ